jgi:hypothetical protein
LQRFLSQNCARVTIFVTIFRVFSAAKYCVSLAKGIARKAMCLRQIGGLAVETVHRNLRALASRQAPNAIPRQPFDFHEGLMTNLSPIWGMRDQAFHSLLAALDTLQPGNFIT